MVTLTNQVLKFPNEVVEIMTTQLEEEIRQRNIAQQIIPYSPIANIGDLVSTYWKMNEDTAVSYAMDISEPPNNAFDVQKEELKLPLLQADYNLGFTNFQNVLRNPIGSFESRRSKIAQTLMDRMEGIAIAGTSAFGTSFADTTNNTTASAAVNPTFATYANVQSFVDTWIEELDDNFDGSGRLEDFPLIMVLNTAGYQKLRKVHPTAGDNIDKTALNYVTEALQAINPASRVVRSKYLGSTFSIGQDGKETNTQVTATGEMCLYLADSQFFQGIESPLEFYQNDANMIDGYKSRWIKRFAAPKFRKQVAFLYDDTITI